ncbi:hypothetical protein [Thalassomonas actiniarum]|uniref:Uncharacterized protein n=1 Tax=Thalassomonas actiniarum TaxID=485447 RepID=A0AAE9YWX9_9GAMM|nr:hypothetical protein [Thalassomonas actiniarum]WDE00998.1 hypothetical protein SG35_010400 [Thalassomonas actiniarum]
MENQETPWWVLPSLIVAILGFLWTVINGLAQKLEDENTRKSIVNAITKKSWVFLYHSWIASVLKRLELFFGPALSLSAFNRCLSIAYIYPLFAFLLSWLLGGNGKIASFVFLPEINQPLYRFFLLVWLILGFGLFFYLLRYFETVAVKLVNVCRIPERFLSSVVTFVILGTFTFNVIFAFVFAVTVTGLGAGDLSNAFFDITTTILSDDFTSVFAVVLAFFFILSGAFAFAVAGVGALALAVGFIFAIVLGGVFATAFGHTNLNVNTVFMLLFISLLPLINALIDYISWFWSRYFLKKASAPDAGYGFIIHILVDLIIACLLLVILCLLLPLTIEVFYVVNTSLPELNWREVARDAVNEPRGQGLFITLMVVTTLIPTLLHILLGLVAAAVNIGGHQLASFLHRHGKQKMWLLVAATWYIFYVLSPFVLVGGGLFLSVYYYDIPISLWLYEFTLWIFSMPTMGPVLILSILLILLGAPLWKVNTGQVQIENNG